MRLDLNLMCVTTAEQVLFLYTSTIMAYIVCFFTAIQIKCS